MEEEIWKPIAGYEGRYEISNLGRVKSLPVKKPTRNGGFFMTKEHFKRPYPQSDGYLQIGLSDSGKKTNFLVHRLVAIAFIPGDHSLEVNHKDFNRTNCRADNLEWATRLGNVEYSHANGRYANKDLRGAGKHKLTREQVVEIRALKGLVRNGKLSERYGVSVGTISCIQRGVYWKHVAA